MKTGDLCKLRATVLMYSNVVSWTLNVSDPESARGEWWEASDMFPADNKELFMYVGSYKALLDYPAVAVSRALVFSHREKKLHYVLPNFLEEL